MSRNYLIVLFSIALIPLTVAASESKLDRLQVKDLGGKATTVSVPQVAVDLGPSLSVRRDELKTEKLSLEVAKLKADSVHGYFSSTFFQAGTLIAALFAAAISFWTAWKTNRLQVTSLKQQNENQRKDRISGLLKELASESASARTAAVQALSEYSSALPFLIYALKIEEDEGVVGTAIVALCGFRDDAMRPLLDQTEVIYEEKLNLAVELICLGENRAKVASEFSIRGEDIRSREESRAGFRIASSVQERTRFALEMAGPIIDPYYRNDRSSIRAKYLVISRGHDNLLRAIEGIIRLSRPLSQTLVLSGSYLSGLDVGGLNITGWDFSKCILDGASFGGAICNGADFRGVRAKNVDFREADLGGANFDGADLKYADFRAIKGRGTHFESAKIYKAKFERADLDDANFKKAKLSDCDVRNSDLRRAVFSQASLHKTTLDTCRFSESVFCKAKITQSNMRNLRFRRANFTGVVLSYNTLLGGDYRQSVFSGVHGLSNRLKFPYPKF